MMGMARNIAGKVGGRRGGSPGCPPGGGGEAGINQPEGGRGGLAELFRQRQQQQGGNRGPVNRGPIAIPGDPGGMSTQGRGGIMGGPAGRMAQQQQLAQQMRAPPNAGGSRAAIGNPRQQRAVRGGPTSYGGGGRRY